MSLFGPVNPLALAGTGWRTLRRAHDRLRADHMTLARRHVYFSPQAMSRYYLYAAVAPSRRTHRLWDSDQVNRAQRFAAAFADEPWTDTPLNADRDVTAFGATGDDGMFERVVYVSRDGLVELLWALECEEVDGERELDVLEIGRVSAALASAVAERGYAEVCRSRRWWPTARRTDWHFAVATAISASDGQQEWTRLRFPTNEPRRATNARAYMPPEGYGRDALRSLPRRQAPSQVPVVLLRELCAANGYFGDSGLEAKLVAESGRRAQPRAGESGGAREGH